MRILILFIGLLALFSCQGKDTSSTERFTLPQESIQEKTEIKQANIQQQRDSVLAVIEQERKARQIEIHSVNNMNAKNIRINLDTIDFVNKEELYAMLKKHIKQKVSEVRKERMVRDGGEDVGIEYVGYNYFHNMDNVFEVLKSWLIAKHFRFPSTEVYTQRLKEVFQYDGTVVNGYPMVVNSYILGFSRTGGILKLDDDYAVSLYDDDLLEIPHYVFGVKGFSFLYASGYLDFNEFPASMYYVENPVQSNIDEDTIKTEEDMYNTTNWEFVFRESIYYQNDYLFNKSKISLNWLYLNDPTYLTMLYERYGYYGDDRLTQFYIDDVKTMYERDLKYDIKTRFRYFEDDYTSAETNGGSLFANPHSFFGTYRGFDKKFLINKKLLEQFVTLTNGKEDYLYPFIIQEFIANINSKETIDYYNMFFSDNRQIDEKLTKDIRMFLIAHLCYYSQKIYDKNPDIAALSPGLSHYSALYSQLYLPESRTELLAYLKKHKYFGYSDYPEMIEEMRMEHGMW
ncbi:MULTISPECIES: hypothetical protein [unclassified Myroides]|uniref:hypothetical protein n=1 Tax=unclassified Myroides TaxID=2642485 RepID=UPI003D2F76E7